MHSKNEQNNMYVLEEETNEHIQHIHHKRNTYIFQNMIIFKIILTQKY